MNFGFGSGSGSSIPSNITAMQGQIIGPPLGSIEIAAGDCLYLKVERVESGDGVISGPMSIVGDVVTVSCGTNTAQGSVSDFDEVGDTVVLEVETYTAGNMRVVCGDTVGLFSPFGDTLHTKSLVSATITDFASVANVASGADGLYLSAVNSEPTHCNSALYTAYNTLIYRSFEITIGNNPANARLCFGTDIDNFVFIVLSNGLPYSVKDGALYSTAMSGYGAITLTAGDKVRLTFFGTSTTPVVQMHVNNVSISALSLARADAAATLPAGSIYPGVAWRDFANTWYSTSLEVSEVAPSRYMHLSLDDFLQPLIDAEALDSVWDQENFALLKRLHDQYGAKFSLFCFVTNGTVSIASITNKHKAELQAASGWLKFGFHCYNITTTYDSGISAATAKEHYDTVIEAIKVFAGQGSIDPMPRIHAFAGTLDQCLAWKDSGAVGFLAADDTRVSYYHSAGDNLCMRQCESLHDYVNSLDFVRTSFRLENSLDVEASISALLNQTGTVKGATNEIVIFSHTYLFANYYGSATGMEEKLEGCCAYAVENGINFDFPYIQHRRGLGNGTLDALTTEPGFALTRTVVSDGPLTDNQIRKNVVEDLK